MTVLVLGVVWKDGSGMKAEEMQLHTKDCQSFKEACCGCCLNMRLSRETLTLVLQRNTDAAWRFARDGRVTVGRLLRWHWARDGILDHLLACWLAGPTLGLTAWIWMRWRGNCPFVGFLQDDPPRVGCLVHPLVTSDGRDWRRWAFPFVPTLRCERDLRCGLLRGGESVNSDSQDWFAVSKIGAATRKPGKR